MTYHHEMRGSLDFENNYVGDNKFVQQAPGRISLEQGKEPLMNNMFAEWWKYYSRKGKIWMRMSGFYQWTVARGLS